MKKISVVIICLCTVAIIGLFSGCQQENSPTINGKWIIKEAIANSTANGVNWKDTTRYTSSDYFEFNTDGTLTIVETAKTYHGKWRLSNNKLFITETNYIDFPSGFDLPILTNTDLQLYYTETNSSASIEEKLNLTR